MEKIIVPIAGMHCRSCELLVEGNLAEIPEVKKSEVNYKKGIAEVYYSGQKPKMSEIENAVRESGYELCESKNKNGVKTAEREKTFFSSNPENYKDLGIALLFLMGVYIVLKVFGLTNINLSSAANPSSLPVVFLVGITAGLSTCMALVGGLILGISARHAELHPEATPMQKFRPHLFFNIGRIASYTVLGGMLGVIGSTVSFSGSVLGLLTIAVGVVMLLLGVKLLGIFPRMESAGWMLPKSIARFFGIKQHQKEYSHRGAAAMGALTFFLPCGFTQTMQLYAVSTGSFTQGALILGVFALGTAPGLLGVGGLSSIVRGVFARRFFVFAGMAVILLAFVNISNGYNLTGWRAGVDSSDVGANVNVNKKSENTTQTPKTNESKSSQNSTPPIAVSSADTQVITTTYTYNDDIQPSLFTVKVGRPVKFVVDVKENGSGCMSTIMIPGLANTPQVLQKGKQLTMAFTPSKKGSYTITCAMGVPRGTLVVE